MWIKMFSTAKKIIPPSNMLIYVMSLDDTALLLVFTPFASHTQERASTPLS